MLLDLNILTEAQINSCPYQWGYFQNIFKNEFLAELNDTFPMDHYELRSSSREDKQYKIYHKILYDSRVAGMISSDLLEPIWSNLIMDLTSNIYIQLLSKIVGRDLSKCSIEINCWKYGKGCWLSSHTDKPEKVASQLFYFNEEWDPNWGGAFRVLNNSDINNYHKEIFPGLGNSIILVRSDNSWHGVSTQQGPENIFRRVLQLIFWE